MSKHPGVIRRALLAHSIYKCRHQRVRSMYIRDIFEKRNTVGETTLVDDLRDVSEEKYHKSYFRMDKEQFDEILEDVRPHIFHYPTHLRPISARDRLAITLRFLATGSKQVYLALNYRVSPSSVSNIIKETMLAICATMEAKYLDEPNGQKFHESAEEFGRKWNFPNVCGAIDGKHIRMKSPPKSGSLYHNYKGFDSIVLLAVADANYKFLMVDIGACGSISDGGVLKNSIMGQKLENYRYNMPKPIVVSESIELPPVILGDDAFPLKPYLMKPYPGRKSSDINIAEKIYNYRHSRARMVVENTFGIFAARWRIFETPIHLDLETTKLAVKTCVILHNFLMARGDTFGMTVDSDINGTRTPGSWRDEVYGDTGTVDLGHQGSNNALNDAFNTRDCFRDYFMTSEGAVAWQQSSALRGYD